MDPDPLPAHLSKILSLSPPQSTHPPSTLTGPLTSHTGLAYLFLAVSAAHPRLHVHSYPATHWARAYISNIPTPSAPLVPFRDAAAAGRRPPPQTSDRTRPDAKDSDHHHHHHHQHHPVVLGLLSDALAGPAVRACVTQDLAHVRFFLSLLAPVLAHILDARPLPSPSTESPPPPLPTCLLHGLAGTLYLLRLIRHWVPSSAPLVSRAIVLVSDYLLSPSTPWTCPSHHHPSFSSSSSSSSSSSFPPHSALTLSPSPSPLSEHVSPADRHGAAHGALGTVTQIVLTSPPLAPALTPRLAALLDLQLPDGDWPAPGPPLNNDDEVVDGDAHHPAAGGGIGFASGPQGLVISLLSLRPFFPTLQARIDGAVAGARHLLWARARARTRAPATDQSLFYGVLGTALALPKGPQRTHLLPLPSAPPPERKSFAAASISSSSTTTTATTPPTATTTTPGALMTSTPPGAAWAYSVREREAPRMIFYNDI
ncbi:uncharacterized protein LY79DRAFT_703518 [Colletotrichum navitas]|uniref:Abscisic acid ABA receptor n=1 Tax=Colletotrichum navitas TaxID=681940 RepID=A0AAD8V5T5_9PEZI|nr:uncharacterized protein LY79DRAFT_703518 [Colletotrichum navitas]KAK1590689.1 hypothetical protein LY79DRAFT_703518 [Colletotrichum navitas]